MDHPILVIAVIAALIYAVVAYIFLPMAWTRRERQPRLARQPMVTQTKQGIPGDAINVGLVGGRDTIIRAMNDAGWYPADVGSSRVDLQACKLEYSIVSPK